MLHLHIRFLDLFHGAQKGNIGEEWVIVREVVKVHDKFSRTTSPTGNYMFKVINGNTRTRCKLCPKLTIKTLEQRPNVSNEPLILVWYLIVKFEHISHLVLVFLMLTWSR